MEIKNQALLASALDGMSGQLHTPPPLSPGKSLRHALDRRLGEAKCRTGMVASPTLPLPGIELQL
jgi:hypothetical protein